METIETLKCPICTSYETTSDHKGKCLSSLINHAKLMHGVNRKSLLKDYNIPPSFIDGLKKYNAERNKRRLRSPVYIKKHNAKLLDEMGEERYNKLPTCKICGYKAKQLYMHINKLHEIDVSDYRSKYTGILEEAEYLEYLSESRRGENNPMFNNGSPELSPFAVEFYIKKGHNPEEAIRLKNEFIKTVHDNKDAYSYTTTVDYYMKKYNIDIEEASDMLFSRQQTNSVRSIAERHNISYEDAKLIRDDITDKWMTTMNEKSAEEISEINRKKSCGKSVSEKSLSFFNDLIHEMKLDRTLINIDDTEFKLSFINDDGIKCYRKYDFKIDDKIIEYNGDIFHANPEKYISTDIPLNRNVFKTRELYKKTAADIWKYDAHKIQLAKDNGYKIFVVWHSDVKKNRYRMLRKCKEFLNDTITGS